MVRLPFTKLIDVPDLEWRGKFRPNFTAWENRPALSWSIAKFQAELAQHSPDTFTYFEEYSGSQPVRLFIDYDRRQDEPVDHAAALEQLLQDVVQPVTAALRRQHMNLDDCCVAVCQNHRKAPKEGRPAVSCTRLPSAMQATRLPSMLLPTRVSAGLQYKVSFHVVWPEVAFDEARSVGRFLAAIGVPPAVDHSIYNVTSRRLFGVVGSHKPASGPWDGNMLTPCHVVRPVWDHLVTYTGGCTLNMVQPTVAREVGEDVSPSQRRRRLNGVTFSRLPRPAIQLPAYLRCFTVDQLKQKATALMEDHWKVDPQTYKWTDVRSGSREAVVFLEGRPLANTQRYCPVIFRNHAGRNAFSCAFLPSGNLQYNCLAPECQGTSKVVNWVATAAVSVVEWLSTSAARPSTTVDQTFLKNAEVGPGWDAILVVSCLGNPRAGKG